MTGRKTSQETIGNFKQLSKRYENDQFNIMLVLIAKYYYVNSCYKKQDILTFDDNNNNK